ncbi:unnamed protein product [Rotaria sp. Silwood2]|nr:unnamed protein product [Rotaria sp. Silwood2]
MRCYQVLLPILFGLILVMALIFNNYEEHSFFHIKINHGNISIEQALQKLPTCTQDDGPRQRALLYALQQWTYFAQQHNIRYWIAYKTLVSYVQHHSLSPHDLDIDLFIMAQDTSQLAELSQFNFSLIYELKVHPQWFIVGETKRSYFYSEGIDFIAPNARFINRKDDIHLDIWPMYDYHPNQTRIQRNSKPILTEYDKNYNWVSSPKQWTFPLQECLFSGIKVWCPAEPEKLVANIYEEISFELASTQCIDGSWVKLHEHTSAETKTTMNSQTISTAQITKAQTTTITLNDNDLIKKALKHIPKCTPNDRSRQRRLLTNLQVWSHLAEQYNLQYWITYGTLVGYVQRRGLLPHDLDVDVIMMSDDTPQLIKLSQSNISSDYEIKVQPQWYIVNETHRSYFREQGVNFIAPNARFIHRETRQRVDIFPAYDFNPLYANKSIENKQSENLTIYDLRYRWLSYPRNWTYPLKTCYFSDIKVLCPSEPEKLVATIYGIDAITKSDTKCVNGSWIKAL